MSYLPIHLTVNPEVYKENWSRGYEEEKEHRQGRIQKEPCQISNMELSVKIVNGLKPLIIFTKRYILDADRVLNKPLVATQFIKHDKIYI